MEEKEFKRCLKRKVKITLSLLTMLFISGGISFGAEELTAAEIKALKEMLKNTKKNNQDAIVIGENAEARKKDGIPGFSRSIDSNDSIAIGKDSSTAGKGSIAIGKNAMTGQKEASGVGINTDEPADGAVSIGYGAHSLTEGSVTIGRNTKAGLKRMGQKEFKGIAIGDGAQAIGGDRKYDEKNNDAGIAIGRKSKANGNYSITIGTEAETENGGNILIGGKAKTEKLNDGLHPFGSIGIGTKSIVKGYNSIALGTEASVGRGQHQMENNGNYEKDQFNGVAIGYKSNTERPASVSLGAYSNTYRQNMTKEEEKEKYGHRKYLPAPYSKRKLIFKSFVDNYYVLGRKETGGDIVSGVVSVGGEYINAVGTKTPFLRQIINLADGTEDTDAVNLRQLKGLEEQMKMKFYTGGTYNNNIYTPSTKQTDKWSTNRMIFGKGLKAELVKDGDNNEYTRITLDSNQIKDDSNFKGEKGDKGENGKQGEKGKDGLSAYEVWKKQGNNGTEQDFLNSLKGKDGKGGADFFEYAVRIKNKDTPLIEAEDGKLYTKEFLDKNEYKNNKWFEKGTNKEVTDFKDKCYEKTDKELVIHSKKKRIIANVKAGVEDTDVVNVSQLNEVKTNVKNIANKVDKIDKKADLALGGVSNAVAMANLVQVNSYSRHRHNLSAAYGYYGGSHALAIGFSGVNEKRNFVYKLSGSVNNHGNLALGLGIGVMLGKEDNEYPVNSKLQEEVKTLKEEVRMLKEALSKVK